MILKLKNITRSESDKSKVTLSLEAYYGFEGREYGDIIRINLDVKKKTAYCTVRIKNPGAGFAASRIVEHLSKIIIDKYVGKKYLEVVIETLTEKFGMESDPDNIASFLSGLE